jgi:hypothetical protein
MIFPALVFLFDRDKKIRVVGRNLDTIFPIQRDYANAKVACSLSPIPPICLRTSFVTFSLLRLRFHTRKPFYFRLVARWLAFSCKPCDEMSEPVAMKASEPAGMIQPGATLRTHRIRS